MEPFQLIGNIVSLSVTIYQAIAQVKANKRQCERLGERIKAMVNALEQLEDIRPEIKATSLKGFYNTMQECHILVNSFKDAAWLKNGFLCQIHKTDFEQLAHHLNQHALDLGLHLDINQLFDREEDKKDREADLAGLMVQLDEIRQINLDHYARHVQQNDEIIRQVLEVKENGVRLLRSFEQSSGITATPFTRIPLHDFLIQDRIGRGTFGDVYRGMWLSCNRQVAIKVIRFGGDLHDSIKQDVTKEISRLCQSRFENVFSALGACIETNYYAIIFEYMSLGSLYDLIHQNKRQLEWHDRWSIALQMCQGLDYLHRILKIVHCAIKASNFLVEQTGSGYLIKVSDFGLARVRQESNRYTIYVGGLQYQAPELLKLSDGKGHSPASDVFALGIVLWELATLCLPYKNIDLLVLSIGVMGGERMVIPPSVPSSMASIIESSWNQMPDERPSCQDLVEKITVHSNDDDHSEAPKGKDNAATILPQTTTDSIPLADGTHPIKVKSSAKPIHPARGVKNDNSTLEDKIINYARDWMNLRKLNLNDQDIPVIIQRAVIEKRCACLILEHNNFTSEGVRMFVDGLLVQMNNNNALKTLQLGWNPLGDEAVPHLARLLTDTDTKLTNLHLERTGLTDQGVEQLANVLLTNSRLTKLCINDNKSITDKSIDSLIKMLEKLKHLYVSNCGLSLEAKTRLNQEAVKIKKYIIRIHV